MLSAPAVTSAARFSHTGAVAEGAAVGENLDVLAHEGRTLETWSKHEDKHEGHDGHEGEGMKHHHKHGQHCGTPRPPAAARART